MDVTLTQYRRADTIYRRNRPTASGLDPEAVHADYDGQTVLLQKFTTE